MLRVGHTYTREQVQRLVGAPVKRGGDWATGYTEFDGAAYAFANVGEAGRTGHDYANRWNGERLVWQSKGGARRGQPRIEGMLSGALPVHMFVRSGDRKPFTYAGIARPHSVTGDAPVTIEWAFDGGRPADPLTADELADELARLGFVVGPIGTKSQSATRARLLVYLKRDSKLSPFVLAPKWQDALDEILALPGVWRSDRDEFFYHQSMLTDFPKRRHTGKTDVPYGLDFEINSRSDLRALVDLLDDWAKRPVSPVVHGTEPDPKTETEAVRAARLGQGKFRDDLLARWNGSCALTGLEMPTMIRASHIKPWRDSAPKERLDPDNGLPLLVHVDLLFDKGLISFRDDGAILISPALTPAQLAIFGIHAGLRIEGLSDGNRAYLKHHRGRFF